jgi:hypothetical protein
MHVASSTVGTTEINATIGEGLERAALDFANHLLSLQGAAPAPTLRAGTPEDTAKCPIARTATVDGSGLCWSIGPFSTAFARGVELYRAETPECARAFMRAWDNGEFPVLIAA